MSYRVCIPTAGTGSRLGVMTDYLNKSLVTVANRPMLSHLIEQFPGDAEFVIALGFKGNLVRDFIELAYPDRTFFFSEVEPFEGDGAGLGLTLLSCMEYLHQPFIFISCDTLVRGDISPPNHNWMGYAEQDDLAQYRTLRIAGQNVHEICEKGSKGDDLKAYIGLAGIHDHELFWQSMIKGGDDAVAMGESYGMRAIVEKGIKSYKFNWFDSGIPEALAKTREAYREANAPNILEKANEAIWFVDEKVIKFSDDKNFISNRVERLKYISRFTPQLLDYRQNMYVYRKVRGNVMSEIVNPPLFEQFLSHCKGFWSRHDLDKKEEEQFRQACRKFYKTKTEQRIKLFYKNFDKCDNTEKINNVAMPLLADLMSEINWEWMTEGVPVQFHGDFHFENILWSDREHRFVFLDWRQDFGGSLETGDIYYDFAKLMHGLIVSHELINKELYFIEWTDNDISFDFNRKHILVECERSFEQWITNEGYDLKKVRVLCALIYLNIAALHHFPYSLLLFGLGKWMLSQELGMKYEFD